MIMKKEIKILVFSIIIITIFTIYFGYVYTKLHPLHVGGGYVRFPQFMWVENPTTKTITITDQWGEKFTYASENKPNLIFMKSEVTYYVCGNNSRYYLSTSTLNCAQAQILEGDIIKGFTTGTYTVIWFLSNTSLGTIVFN